MSKDMSKVVFRLGKRNTWPLNSDNLAVYHLIICSLQKQTVLKNVVE